MDNKKDFKVGDKCYIISDLYNYFECEITSINDDSYFLDGFENKSYSIDNLFETECDALIEIGTRLDNKLSQVNELISEKLECYE